MELKKTISILKQFEYWNNFNIETISILKQFQFLNNFNFKTISIFFNIETISIFFNFETISIFFNFETILIQNYHWVMKIISLIIAHVLRVYSPGWAHKRSTHSSLRRACRDPNELLLNETSLRSRLRVVWSVTQIINHWCCSSPL